MNVALREAGAAVVAVLSVIPIHTATGVPIGMLLSAPVLSCARVHAGPPPLFVVKLEEPVTVKFPLELVGPRA